MFGKRLIKKIIAPNNNQEIVPSFFYNYNIDRLNTI